MKTKMPTVANLFFNLMLLVTLAEHSPCLAPGYILNPEPYTCNP